MSAYHKFILTLSFLFVWVNAFSQTGEDAKTLVSQGVALNDSGKYDAAIAKYNQAIKIDPNYGSAYYEIAYTYFTSGKEKEAIPYLEKLLSLDPKAAAGYDMLGSIYDDQKQPDKALEYYKKGVEADPGYQLLHYNMAITYYSVGKYPESEAAAIEAIKLNPKHASSQRVYAMATYQEHKRGCSLLAWCSFLMIEPQSKRSRVAFSYIKDILNYGITYQDKKNINIKVSPDNTSSLMMPLSVIAATRDKKNLNATDSVQLQLTSLFQIAHSIMDEKTPTMASTYFADFFQKLGASGNMPAFTRYISLCVNKDENQAWFKEHDKELNDFDKWVAATERKF